MRNGNKERVRIDLLEEERSYRTYEEWKRKFPKGQMECLLSSYRTYEEWKRGS